MKYKKVNINLVAVYEHSTLFKLLCEIFGGYGENGSAFIDTITDSWSPEEQSISNFKLEEDENMMLYVNGIQSANKDVLLSFIHCVKFANEKLVEMDLDVKIFVCYV